MTRGCCSGNITLDLVVSATNQLTPIIRSQYGDGFRALRYSQSKIEGFEGPHFAALAAISPTLSGDNSLQLQMKNTDGSSTVGLQYHSITKFIKEA